MKNSTAKIASASCERRFVFHLEVPLCGAKEPQCIIAQDLPFLSFREILAFEDFFHRVAAAFVMGKIR